MKRILQSNLVTEKTSLAMEQGKYVFYVDPNVNKTEIKYFVQSLYGVDVVKVASMNVKGKKRRRGRIIGRTNNRKKAIVTLKEGQTIDKLKGK